MKDRRSIQELMDYLQTVEERELQFEKDAIIAAFESNNNQSLVIKVLSIFGGLLASVAFLVFLYGIGLYDSALGVVFFGIVCLLGAIWLNKISEKIIIDTVSVSFYIIGFVLLALGLGKLEMNENTICVLFMAISVISLLTTRNFILSFIAVLVLNGSVLTLILLNNNYDLIHLYVSVLALILTYVFLKEARILTLNVALSKLYGPSRVGLLFSFLFGLIVLGKGIIPLSLDYIWISSFIFISVIIYLISCIIKVIEVATVQQKVGIFIFSVLLLLSTIFSPAITGAILIILLSFMVNYRFGFGIGIISFVYFLSQYYYDLNFTLLTKSILLFSTGVLFIILYFFTYKKLAPNEKV